MTEPARGRRWSASLLRFAVDVRPNETAVMWTSFVFFFFVLSSYFILRPIRDAVAVQTGVTRLPWLFAGTLIVMLIANPLFSSLVVRFPVRRFVPMTYLFFAANLLVFFFIMRTTASAQSLGPYWISVVFYIWTSVYNLFITSVFWCLMADVFRSEQAKRLFGFIGVGGTLGSISGSAITAVLATRLGTVNLLLVSVTLLTTASLIVARFPASPNAGEAGGGAAIDRDERPIGGTVWAGVTSLMRSRYLLGIGGFQILYTIGNTLLYFELTDIVGRYFAGAAQRTSVLAWTEFAVQTLTVLTQFFLTGRLIRWLGLGATLALLPAITVLGFTALGFSPLLATVVVFTVLRRGTNFAITNPAVEVLFTVVRREDKYKAKSFIETFVYRAGDQIGAWSFRLFVAVLGASAAAFGAVPFAAVWLALGLWLGRRQAQLAETERRDEPAIGLPQPADSALALNR
ncbi:MAG TPA: MFS transporter [Gemmatimonadaceae bacterium]|nr:MFS transporter [Gemmatimonadaceae bacterium]